jgi:hypothetical protein
MKQVINRISRTSQYLGLLLALCLILAPTSLQAGGLGEQEVRTAVETWVRYVTADARPDAVIERMEPHKVDGETVAYIAHLKGGGFCLCGADDLVLPVYLYSPQGTYDPENPNYQYILWEIGTRLKNLQKGLAERAPSMLQYQEALSERASFWQDLIAGRIPASVEAKGALAEPVMMELDLTSQWAQGSPYNDRCPELTPGADEHTLVGCTATATAQIMYYWKWPHTGVDTGSVNYNWRWRTNWDEEPLANDPGIPANWGGGGRLEYNDVTDRLRMNGYWDGSVYGNAQRITDTVSYQNALAALWNRLATATTPCGANFGATTYNWSIMEDTHTDPPDTGDAEVAKLCYHVAIAVDTSFGIWGSGSDNWRVPEPLRKYFRYDPDVTYGPPDVYTMTEEIQWLRPFGFSGSQNGGGHAWVIFGYNKGTSPWQFKMNMGWGWDYTNPPYGWYSLDNVPNNLNLNHRQLVRIAPLNVVKFVGDNNPGDGSPDDPYEDIEEAIAEAPDGATLIFKAGSDNTFSAGTLTINQPFTLKGKDVTIRKE